MVRFLLVRVLVIAALFAVSLGCAETGGLGEHCTYADACSEIEFCNAGLVCDGTNTCVTSLDEPTFAEGTACQERADVRCAAPTKGYACLGALATDGGTYTCETVGDDNGAMAGCCVEAGDCYEWTRPPTQCDADAHEFHCGRAASPPADAGACTAAAANVYCCAP